MGSVFSKDYHDNGKRKKKRKASIAPPIIRKPPRMPEGSLDVVTPTEEQRRLLRASQRDPDLEGYQRRTYQHQDGSTNHSEPHRLPPRYDQRKPRVIQTDPDLLTNQDVDQNTQSEHKLEEYGSQDNVNDGGILASNLGRIADISLKDLSLNKLDQTITDAFTAIRNLREAAEHWHRQVERQGNDQQIHSSEQIAWISAEALLPWLNEVDKNFQEMLASNVQA